MRMAGRPMRTAANAPAPMPRKQATKKSMLWSATMPPLTAAPMPTRPNWPRLICPAQPVRTTRLTATIAYSGAAAARAGSARRR